MFDRDEGNHFLGFFGARVCLASVSVDDVRACNVSSAEVPDAKVLKLVKRAEEGKVKITEKKDAKRKQYVFELVKG